VNDVLLVLSLIGVGILVGVAGTFGFFVIWWSGEVAENERHDQDRMPEDLWG